MIQPFESVMMRTLLGPMVAALQIFALYVVVHGHYSPGGGFQGGVLFGASIVLPLLVQGRRSGFFVLSQRAAIVMAAGGVLVFLAFGLFGPLAGQPVLDYAAVPLSDYPAYRRSLSILGIEIGVTMAVAGSVVSIFYILYEEVNVETDSKPATEEPR
ncbi:MAG: MnhB domain-containing protein [Phycisphaeraceae bacterium]